MLQTYFISDGVRVKIGKSSNPAKRLTQLQTAHSIPLYLLATMFGDHERTFHKLFARFHERGEWFTLDTEHIELIRSLTTPMHNRCIGITANGQRCQRSQTDDQFCHICGVGPWLCLSDSNMSLLASSQWDTHAEAKILLDNYFAQLSS